MDGLYAWFSPEARLISDPKDLTWNTVTNLRLNGEVRAVRLREDEAGIRHSARLLNMEVRRLAVEMRVTMARVVLGGFSQGGAMAMYICVDGVELGGCISAAGWLPLNNRLSLRPNSPGSLIMHGQDDAVVDVERAKSSARRLILEGGAAVRVHLYPGLGHTLGDGEVAEMRKYLRRVTKGTLPIDGWTEANPSWVGVPGTVNNNCDVRPSHHRTCSNEAERTTLIGVDRAACFQRCLSSPVEACGIVQYQHDVLGDAKNNWCHMLPRCVPGDYQTEQSSRWCVEVLARAG